MVAGLKAVGIAASTFSVVSLLSGLVYFYNPFHGDDGIPVKMYSDQSGAIAGRIVSIPAKVYVETFKTPIHLGQCPLVMVEGKLKTCPDEFEGEVVHLAKASTTVDVKRVQTAEDILMHYAGGLGTSVGVLGLVSVGLKYKVAVTTQTNKKSLNLISSYEMKTGVWTLHNPRPKRLESNRPLFLSEIELGGNEMILVTLEFMSEEKKVEVEITATFKILFISISAKLKFIHTTMKSEASCRIQFKSSWRKDLDIKYSDLGDCIPKVEEIEDMYMQGPRELKNMDVYDERSHYFYYFSSWRASPYGARYNMALIHHDLEFLNGQKTEMQSVIEQITKLKDGTFEYSTRRQLSQLNSTLTDNVKRLESGLERYHNLDPTGRQQLRDIYGFNNAPQFYQRLLNKIVA